MAGSSRRWLAGGLVALAATLGSAPASAGTSVSFTAGVNGHDVADADANDPAPLRPERPIAIALTITNGTGERIVVRSVRISGTIIGLTFFAYEVRADITVAPNATERRTFEIDPADLGDQAIGLVPARVELLGRERDVLAADEFVVDVRGSMTSVLGVFAAGVTAVTAALLATALLRLSRHRLPAGRWRRATRFAAPGFGLGLTATFTLSVFRILVPRPELWLPLVFGGGVISFVLGYLTPHPRTEAEEAEELADDTLAAQAVLEAAAAGEAVVEGPPIPGPPAPDAPSPPPPGPERSTVITNEPLPPPP